MITCASGDIDCDDCGIESINIDLIEFAGGTWGDDDEITLPDGWTREYEHGNSYSHYCPSCSEERKKDE